MNKPTYKKILDHPDREEIISKLVMGISAKDINEWLKDKYTSINEPKFIISEKIIKSFQSTYLDFYNNIHQDLSKTKTAIATSNEDQLELAVKGNSAYRSAMV